MRGVDIEKVGGNGLGCSRLSSSIDIDFFVSLSFNITLFYTNRKNMILYCKVWISVLFGNVVSWVEACVQCIRLVYGLQLFR